MALIDPGVTVGVIEIKCPGTGESIVMDSSPLVLGEVNKVPETPVKPSISLHCT